MGLRRRGERVLKTPRSGLGGIAGANGFLPGIRVATQSQREGEVPHQRPDRPSGRRPPALAASTDMVETLRWFLPAPR